MISTRTTIRSLATAAAIAITCSANCWALSSTNLPLNSPVYHYIDKLAGMGLITSDMKGLRPYSKGEVARLTVEASKNVALLEPANSLFAMQLIARIRELIPREFSLKKDSSPDEGRTAASSNVLSPTPDNEPYGAPNEHPEGSRIAKDSTRNGAGQDETLGANAGSRVSQGKELTGLQKSPLQEGSRSRKPPFFDYNPVASLMMRYVYLDGAPRNYTRPVFIRGGQSAFGFIGGTLRPQSNAAVLSLSGTEGTPLSENNNGIIYKRGQNGEVRLAAEAYISDKVSALIEPLVQYTPGDARLFLNRGYVKLGGGGLELEVGRDENWFGPGYRGALTLSNNARNFDQIKISSPEPLDVSWVKRWIGDLKYAVIVSRFDETDVGTADYRRPYFIGIKLDIKPYSWFEYGFNFVRQQGGPGFTGSTSIKDEIFGGGTTNHSNTIAGIDLRFRIPWLRNTEIYGEYAGEDSAAFWPIVESYVAGIYAPCLTATCRDSLRFEFFWGNPMLYTDYKFPRGYTYRSMNPGHSQGGAAQDCYVQYSHSFSPRNRVQLEYFHTDRGQEGRVAVNSSGQYDPVNGVRQAVEHKDAGRVSWQLPIFGAFDGQLLYGIERIRNLDLAAGSSRTNHLVSFEIRYQY